MRTEKLVKVLLVLVVGFTSMLALSCGDDDGAVNECALGTDDCGEHATCTDTAESFTCTCNPLWEGNGKTCDLIKVLIYHDGGSTVADEAVTAFGLTSIYTTNGTDFKNAFDAGGFGLIIWESPSFGIPSGAETRLAAWVDAGERLIFSWWDLDSSASIQSLLGVSVVSYSTWREVSPDPDSSVTFFGGVPPPLTGSDQAADNGDELTLTGDGFLAARLDSTVGPGAIAVTHGGNVIVNGFLPWDCRTTDNDDDGTPDMQQIYWNQIAYLTGVSKQYFAVYAAAFGGDPWREDVRDKIANIGLSVDFYDTSTTPILTELQSYDAVLVFSDGGESWDGEDMGDVLADYMDNGGGVVVCTFAYNTSGLGISGRIESDGYLPFTKADQNNGTTLTLVAAIPAHPILFNVDSFNGGESSYHEMLDLTAGAKLVAHWDNDYPVVATKKPTAGRIVGLNFYPPSSDAREDFWDSSTDGDWLMANALLWASGGAEFSLLFSEDFESGGGGWTTELYGGATDDLWHVTGPNTNSPTQSMWCGDEATGDYDTGNRINTAVLSPSIDLTGSTAAVLVFWEYYDTEGGWDHCMVDISTDGGATWTQLRGSGPTGDSGGWIRTDIGLSAYVGNTVNIRFYFDTLDDDINAYPGWFVDDIVIYGID